MAAYETTMVKVNASMATDTAKSMKAADIPHLHCDVKPNALLLPRHLLSCCLYSGFTELCTHFGATFRIIKPFETLSSVKARHSHYWWLSKSLFELVQFYGISGEGEYNENTGKYENKLCGPFYCGMCGIMPFPEVSIRVNCPLSTSYEIRVAMKFADSDHDGIVIQFNNTADYYSKRVRGFPTGWLSQYTDENEVLFFGSDFRLPIESTRTPHTKQIFEVFCGAIYKFECMLNGCRPRHKIKMTEDELLIIDSLCNWRLGNFKAAGKIHRFVLDTFANVCTRTHIALNLWCLDTLFPNELTDLLMQSI
eukprot:288356_1